MGNFEAFVREWFEDEVIQITGVNSTPVELYDFEHCEICGAGLRVVLDGRDAPMGAGVELTIESVDRRSPDSSQHVETYVCCETCASELERRRFD